MLLRIDKQGYASPDSTYFRTTSAEPELERDAETGEQVLKLVNGTGTRRTSWGQPGVTSTVALSDEALVAIHVGFFHKHGGGQFWRYYRPASLESGVWEQQSWAQLGDSDRMSVLVAYQKMPDWVKSPGKLRSEYTKPTLTVATSYKLVQVREGGRYYSLYDDNVEYTLGRRKAQKALEEHEGGYYSYPEAGDLLGRFWSGVLFWPKVYQQDWDFALLECEISGTLVHYNNGKIASTYLRPLRELDRFHYSPQMRRQHEEVS